MVRLVAQVVQRAHLGRAVGQELLVRLAGTHATCERVELVFTNKTPMPHPMHLHGHSFQVVEMDGKRFSGARRDTVSVTPGSRVVVAFDANNPGWWAMHCHLLYHQAGGMFTTISYV